MGEPYRWSLHDAGAKLEVVASGKGTVGLNSDAVFFVNTEAFRGGAVLREARTGAVIQITGTRIHEVAAFDPARHTFFGFSFADQRLRENAGTLSVSRVDAATGKELWAQKLGETSLSVPVAGGVGRPPISLSFTPDGKRILVIHTLAEALRLWVGTIDGSPEHGLLLYEKPTEPKSAPGWDSARPCNLVPSATRRTVGTSPST